MPFFCHGAKTVTHLSGTRGKIYVQGNEQDRHHRDDLEDAGGVVAELLQHEGLPLAVIADYRHVASGALAVHPSIFVHLDLVLDLCLVI